ncbi:TPA_asm: UL28.4 sORF [Human alphaherpesvirus 1]|nr:TPA_asm: UL28.4 sORF [Human alphaherpesvirus 1]
MDGPAIRIQPDPLVIRTGSGQAHGLREKRRDVSRGRERLQAAQEPLALAPRVL